MLVTHSSVDGQFRGFAIKHPHRSQALRLELVLYALRRVVLGNSLDIKVGEPGSPKVEEVQPNQLGVLAVDDGVFLDVVGVVVALAADEPGETVLEAEEEDDGVEEGPSADCADSKGCLLYTSPSPRD